MTPQKLEKLIEKHGPRMYPLEVLKQLGGYYNCLQDDPDNLHGPLVGYAGKYEANDNKEMAYVGHLYANFAKAEEWPFIIQRFGQDLGYFIATYIRNYMRDKELRNANENGKLVIAGPEKGGFSIAEQIALSLQCRKVYIEKEITQQKSATSREQSKLVFKRHSIYKGDFVFIAEDVSNNFSTTKNAVKLIESYGATVVGISTILNRSPHVEHAYELEDGRKLPVFALQRLLAPEFKQDDPIVAGHIASGNIIWKPKDEWEKLPAECKQ